MSLLGIRPNDSVTADMSGSNRKQNQQERNTAAHQLVSSHYNEKQLFCVNEYR